MNSQQSEALRKIEKPLLIIAGADSGKTVTVESKILFAFQKPTYLFIRLLKILKLFIDKPSTVIGVNAWASKNIVLLA